MASTGTNMAQSNPDLQKAVKYCPACSIIVFPAKDAVTQLRSQWLITVRGFLTEIPSGF